MAVLNKKKPSGSLKSLNISQRGGKWRFNFAIIEEGLKLEIVSFKDLPEMSSELDCKKFFINEIITHFNFNVKFKFSSNVRFSFKTKSGLKK